MTVYGQHQAPSKPDAPTLTPTDGTFLVKWTAPDDSGSSPIIYYWIGYRVLPHGAWAELGPLNASTCCSYTLGSTLYQDKEYVVRVRAQNNNFDSGKGPWSDTTLGIAKTPCIF